MKNFIPTLLAAIIIISCDSWITKPYEPLTEEAVIGHWVLKMEAFSLNSFLGYQMTGEDFYHLYRHQYFERGGFFREEWSGMHITLRNLIPRSEEFGVLLSDTGSWRFENGAVIIKREKCFNPTRESNKQPIECGCNEYYRREIDTIRGDFYNENTWVRTEVLPDGPRWPVEARWWRMNIE